MAAVLPALLAPPPEFAGLVVLGAIGFAPLVALLDSIVLRIAAAAGDERVDVVAATRLATALMGDSIATNLFMLGYAWQKGLIPVSFDALMRPSGASATTSVNVPPRSIQKDHSSVSAAIRSGLGARGSPE